MGWSVSLLLVSRSVAGLGELFYMNRKWLNAYFVYYLFLSLFSFFPATALVHLCKQRDSETRRLALQTLELLAIENSDIIVTHVSGY